MYNFKKIPLKKPAFQKRSAGKFLKDFYLRIVISEDFMFTLPKQFVSSKEFNVLETVTFAEVPFLHSIKTGVFSLKYVPFNKTLAVG